MPDLESDGGSETVTTPTGEKMSLGALTGLSVGETVDAGWVEEISFDTSYPMYLIVPMTLAHQTITFAPLVVVQETVFRTTDWSEARDDATSDGIYRNRESDGYRYLVADEGEPN